MACAKKKAFGIQFDCEQPLFNMKSFVVAIFVTCFVVASGEKARYDNYRVYSLEVVNEEQLRVLRELEMYPDGTSFLESPTGLDQIVDLTVPPHKFADITELLETYDIMNWIKTKNLQE